MDRYAGLSLRVSPDELALFHALARVREATLSGLIRELLVNEAAAAGLEVPAVPPAAA